MCFPLPPPRYSYMPLWPVLRVGPFSFSTQTLYSFDTLLHHFSPSVVCYDHCCSHLPSNGMLGPIHPSTPVLWILALLRCLAP